MMAKNKSIRGGVSFPAERQNAYNLRVPVILLLIRCQIGSSSTRAAGAYVAIFSFAFLCNCMWVAYELKPIDL